MKKGTRQFRPLVLMSTLAPSGAEQVTVSFLRRLKSTGRDVPLCIVSARQYSPLTEVLKEASIRRLDLDASRLAEAAPLVRLSSILRRERFDLVHAHGQDATIVAALVCKIHRVPLVVTRHVLDDFGHHWRERLRGRVMSAALRHARVLVAVSRATATALEKSGIPRDRIRVINNGIELDRFALNGQAASAALRAEWGLAGEDRIILCPSVMRPGKGHDVLLNALPRILAQVPTARLVFAGAGPLETALRARARVYGDAVMFLGHRTDMPALLNAADVVVLASESEALPTVLIEAAAAGRPVVSTRVGGVEEVVRDGSTGILVPPNEPSSLATAVFALLRDRNRAETLGRTASVMAAERFGIETQVERTWELWGEVCAHATAA